jgi:hypothetical protein
MVDRRGDEMSGARRGADHDELASGFDRDHPFAQDAGEAAGLPVAGTELRQ